MVQREDIATITGYIDGEQNLNIYFRYPCNPRSIRWFIFSDNFLAFLLPK